MTDNEIIKALECCCKEDCTLIDGWCNGCPMDKLCDEDADALIKSALDLINRQKAENERLKTEIRNTDNILNLLDRPLVEVKSEAIKEVLLTLEAEVESSNKYIREYDDSKEQKAYNKAFMDAYNLVKEMVKNDG